MRVGTFGTGQKVQKWAVFKHLNSAVGFYTLQNFEYHQAANVRSVPKRPNAVLF
jgi:hypothetical protein